MSVSQNRISALFSQKTIFPNKIIFDGKIYRINEKNNFVTLLTNKQRGLAQNKKRQEVKNNNLSLFAPPLGLEPRTL